MKNLKKTAVILGIVLLLAVGSLVAFYAVNKPNLANGVAVEAESNEYVIGVYEEKIAVFTQGDKLPIEIFDVYVSTLPEKDQKDLQEGIKVNGKLELKQKIEDYTS